jgi:DNA-binding transcriptional LysR family regulator
MHGMHIDDLNFTQIRLIAELARLHSVSAAAQSMGLSQSAASHSLAELRKQLGDPLFARTEAGFQPTPYGERLGAAAREALEVLTAGLTSNRPFQARTATRQFNVYLSDVGQMVFLPPLLTFLKKEAPNASVRSVPIPMENPGLALSSGDVDLAVGFFTNLTTGFRQSLLFRERYVCAVDVNHPSFRAGMTLDAFVSTRHAIADATGMAHAVVDSVLAKHSIRRDAGLRVPGFHVLPTIIANSDLLAIIPGRLADTFAPHVPIKILPLPVPVPDFDVTMFWHERYDHDPANRWLRAAFTKLFQGKDPSVGRRSSRK